MLQVVKANNLECETITRYYRVTEAVSNVADVLQSVSDGSLLKNNVITTLDDNSAAVLANVVAEIMPAAQVCAINLTKFPVIELIAHHVPNFEMCFNDERLLEHAKKLEEKRKESEFMVVVTYTSGSDVRLVTRKPLEKIPASPPGLDALTMEDNVAQDVPLLDTAPVTAMGDSECAKTQDVDPDIQKNDVEIIKEQDNSAVVTGA